MYHSPWETKGEGMQGDFTELLADKEDTVPGHLIKIFCLLLCNKTEVSNLTLASLLFLYLYWRIIREFLLASIPTS